MTENKRKKSRRVADRAKEEDWKQSFEFLSRYCPDSVLVIQASDLRIRQANDTAQRTYIYPRSRLLTLTLDDLTVPGLQDETHRLCAKAPVTGESFETRHVKENGDIFQALVHARPMLIDEEKHLLCVIRDLSLQEQSETGARPDEDGDRRALFNAVTESFFLSDTDGTILAANDTFAKRLRMGIDKIVGSSLFNLLPVDLVEARRRQIQGVLQSGRAVRFEEVVKNRTMDQVIYPAIDAAGQVTRLVFFGADITRRREMAGEIASMAITDQLTGLYNRKGFFILASRELKHAKRSQKNMLVFFADLDGLTAINEQLGNEQGDRAILAASQILTSTFRASDIVARLGDDDFAILAVDADADVLEVLLRRFYRLINQYNARKGQVFKLAFSIGHALLDPASSASLEELLVEADQQMRNMKKVKYRRV